MYVKLLRIEIRSIRYYFAYTFAYLLEKLRRVAFNIVERYHKLLRPRYELV